MKSIMIQGTMSSAGKSFVAAGLCRILMQDGFSVAPFKSQNMALNSFVTADGLEMGRAQVMQAEAAGIEPSVLMNPILLKPTGDSASQVIVNGEVLGNMSAKEYFDFKKSLIPQIKAAFEGLSSEHEIIVIEGAGSPAEINLKENDIVNMGMAEIVDTPVILVADIDRGGVFAQLLGTVELLAPEERRRVKGMIINKFRGDVSILEKGIRMIEERTKIPVIGTIPYVKIELDDEDSLSENLNKLTKFRDKNDEIQLAVVRLPHISNFTDFNPLARHGLVNLYYASNPKALGNSDAIIVPGTKNTLADLKWLKESGLSDLLQKKFEEGVPIIGICGGFQILGKKIIGNEIGETGETETAGLALLPVETEFSSQKNRGRVSGKVRFDENQKNLSENIFSGLQDFNVSGYEIHMGLTKFEKGQEISSFARIRDEVSGEFKEDGAVFKNALGTYIHGLFDDGGFRRKFIEILARRKNIDLAKIRLAETESQILNGKEDFGTEDDGGGSISRFKESQYNLLAETLRKHLDMRKIYEIIG